MKKAKSQAVACSLDTNKNGQQHVHFYPDVDDDPSSANMEDLDNAAASATRAATANLSRKKATPPQPAKKLVIKLVKGSVFFMPLRVSLSQATVNFNSGFGTIWLFGVMA